jgi:hypothetical protein
MDFVIFALVVLLIVGAVIWVVRSSSVPAPMNWIVQLAAIIVGGVVILHKAGVF